MFRSARVAMRAMRTPQILRSTATRRVFPAVRAFSVARPVGNISQANSDLVAALRSELKIEEQTASEIGPEEAERITTFAKDNGFEIVAKDGLEEVQLVKKVSESETVRVFFSITDVINSESLLDDQVDAAAAEEQEEEEYETPIRLNIVVEKPQGALGIEAMVQDDLVLVESLTPYASAQLALEESADADYKRRQTYQGPPYSVLDPSLQSAVMQYLESRGIDGDFALFVAEYSSFRENKEYASWLANIAKFVEN